MRIAGLPRAARGSPRPGCFEATRLRSPAPSKSVTHGGAPCPGTVRLHRRLARRYRDARRLLQPGLSAESRVSARERRGGFRNPGRQRCGWGPGERVQEVSRHIRLPGWPCLGERARCSRPSAKARRREQRDIPQPSRYPRTNAQASPAHAPSSFAWQHTPAIPSSGAWPRHLSSPAWSPGGQPACPPPRPPQERLPPAAPSSEQRGSTWSTTCGCRPPPSRASEGWRCGPARLRQQDRFCFRLFLQKDSWRFPWGSPSKPRNNDSKLHALSWEAAGPASRAAEPLKRLWRDSANRGQKARSLLVSELERAVLAGED